LQEQWDKAIGYCQDALALKRATNHHEHLASTLINLANIHESRGDLAQAATLLHEALAHCRQFGDRVGEAQSLNNLAIVSEQRGDWAAAISLYQAALALKVALGDRHSEGLTLMNLGDLYATQGMGERAHACHHQALSKLHPDSPEYADLAARMGAT
jgi:tetratricopeptide (TPR) repeat protein